MSTSLTNSYFAGLDISKDKVDVFIYPSGQQGTYTKDALDKLVSLLVSVQPAWIVLEPTGGYELPVVKALTAKGLHVARPHVTRVSYHVRGRHLSKSDKLDAKALADYARCYADELKAFFRTSAKSISKR